MNIFDMIHASNVLFKGLDAGIGIAENQYDIDISDQQINEYFDVMSHIDRYYYNNSNFMLISLLKTIALKKDFTQILTNNPACAITLRKSIAMLGIESIRIVGKDIIVYIIKQWIDRVFSDMRYDLYVHPELIQNINIRNYLITLNHIIRVKIKKYIQMDADFCEQIAKSISMEKLSLS